MPSLKLSNPFRRVDGRPSLKERAAALKVSASRVLRGRGNAPAAVNTGMPSTLAPVRTASGETIVVDLAAAVQAAVGDPRPDFTGYSVKDLALTFDAFASAAETMNLTTWGTSQSGKGDLLLDDEIDRLWTLCDHIVHELTRRPTNSRAEGGARLNALVRFAVSRGDYSEAATYASEAHGKGF